MPRTGNLIARMIARPVAVTVGVLLVVLIGATALQIYNAARAAGNGKLDQTVVARELERMSGATLGVLGKSKGA